MRIIGGVSRDKRGTEGLWLIVKGRKTEMFKNERQGRYRREGSKRLEGCMNGYLQPKEGEKKEEEEEEIRR